MSWPLSSVPARSFALSIVIWVALAFVVAYLFQAESDRAVPVGASAILDIEAIPQTISKEQLIERLSVWAKGSGINVYKTSPDPSHPDNGRVLHEFLGDPSSAVGGSERKYPSFTPWFITRIEPSWRIRDEDMRGSYAVYGNDDHVQALLSCLREVGVAVSSESTMHRGLIDRMMTGKTPLAGVLVICTLMLLLATSTFASRRRLISLTRSILGNRDCLAVFFDYAIAVGIYAAVVAGASIAALPVLWLWNDFHQFLLFVRSALLICAFGFVAMLIGWTFVLLRFNRMSVTDAIKGKRPWLIVESLSWITQASAFVAAFVILGSATATLSEITMASRDDAKWSGVGTAVTLRFASTTTAEDFSELSERFASLYRTSELKNTVILAKPPTTPAFRAGDHGPFEGNSLIVNPEYLNRNTVVDSNGARVEALELGPGEMALLIPDAFWTDRAGIESDYRDWAEFQRSQSSASLDLVIRTAKIGGKQHIFNYGANGFAFGSAQENPVLAVVSERSNILPPDFYVSAASNGAIIFDNAGSLRAALEGYGLSTHVVSIDSAAGLASTARADRVGIIWALALNALVVLIAMAVATAALTNSYLGRRSAVTLARIVHGHTFMARHSEFLIAGASVGVVAAWLCAATGAIESSPAFAGTVTILVLHITAVMALLRLGESSASAISRPWASASAEPARLEQS